MKYFLSTFLLLFTGIASLATCADTGFYEVQPGFFSSLGSFPRSCDFYTPWKIQLDVGYAAGKFIGLKEGYAEFGALVASESYGEFQPLADLKAYRLNNGHWASSIGFGLRWWDQCSRIWGANIFYDYRKAHIGNFNRFGLGFELLGLELLGTCLDYRLNFYIPFKSENSEERESQPYKFCTEKEYTFSGLDFEIGGHLWQWCDFELDGAAGPYYYHHKNFSENKSNIYGAQARLGLNWTRYLSFETRVSCDNEFHTRVQGEVILNIPLCELFCGSEHDDWRESITRPIQRNGVIFTHEPQHEEKNCRWNTKPS